MTEMIKPKISLKNLQNKSQEELLQIAQQVVDLKKSRQTKKLDDYLKTMHDGQKEFHKLNKRITFVWAGNRCVRGDTKIWTDEGLIEISKINRPMKYLSYDHVSGVFRFAEGSRPFPKGKENLYRVSHEHGEFYSSGSHMIFSCENGYQHVHQLASCSPCFLARPQTILGSCLRLLHVNARRLRRRLSNYLDDCLAYIRLCGRQPLMVKDIFQASAPLQDDVLKFSQACGLWEFGHEDDQSEHGQANIHPSQVTARTSNSYFSPEQVRPLSDEDNQTQARWLARISVYSLIFWQFLLKKFVLKPILGLRGLTPNFWPCHVSLQQTIIKSIEKTDIVEDVWDIQVENTNNYIDEHGVIHHNSGKTTSGAVELIWSCMGVHPYKKNKIPIKTAVVGPDFENHNKQILEPKFKQWAPSNSIRKIDRHQGGAMKRIHWTSGSTTDFFSWDQDSMVFEGSDYDLVWLDEPPPKWLWQAMWRSCVDRGGRMYMTATPLMVPWLYEVYQQIKNHDDPVRDYVRFKRFINAKNIGDGDEALGLKRLEEFSSEFNEEEKAARLDGDFVQVQGLVFKSWDRSRHIIPTFEVPSQWHIYESIDPHPHKPWAVCWIAHAPNGAKILLQSILAEGVIDEIANQIIYARGQIPVKNNLQLKIHRTLIDNASSVPLWQKSATDPTARRISVREELENMIGPRGAGGPRVEVAPKNVAHKIDILKRWLHIKEYNNVKRPDFFVFNDKNEDFVNEIENYVWDRYKARQDGGLKDKPVKKNDDLLDAVMQVALVLGSKSVDTKAEITSLIDGLGTYGGSNFGSRRNLQTRQDTIAWEN